MRVSIKARACVKTWTDGLIGVGVMLRVATHAESQFQIGGSPMHARVIHFGRDDCHRLMVLRSAGYTVENCYTLVQLRFTLVTGDVPDAVLMSDVDGVLPQEAAAVARLLSTSPVILFRTTNQAYEPAGVDLVIPCLTPPEIWLKDIDELIEKRRPTCVSLEARLGQTVA